MRRLVSVVVVAFAAVFATVTAGSARQLTAVCSEISGFRLDEVGNKVDVDEDMVKDATWTFRWNSSDLEVHMIMQNSKSAGGAQFSQQGIKFGGYSTGSTQESFVTFLSPLNGSVWLYTIYFQGSRILVTQHSFGTILSGKMMDGVCHIS